MLINDYLSSNILIICIRYFDRFDPICFVPSFGADSALEASTAELDSTAMKYLSWVLYPLCLGGAVYSLVYTPHKSWYSWTVQTTVNGVYAFGFLFMLPQLFLNYKLKSVAHLPWSVSSCF